MGNGWSTGRGRASQTRSPRADTPWWTRIGGLVASVAWISFAVIALTQLPSALGLDPDSDPEVPVLFTICDPNDGETMYAVCEVRIHHELPDFERVVVRSGNVVLASRSVYGSPFSVSIDTRELPNGPALLTADAYDAGHGHLASETIQVVIKNPVVAVSAVQTANGTTVLSFDIQGIPDDMVYVVLVSAQPGQGYFSEFGLTLPLDPASTVPVAAGAFPPEYDGTRITVATTTPPITAQELYVVLLSWNPDGWHASRVAKIQP